jgi:hypothetical protein
MIVNKGDFIESIPEEELGSVAFRCGIPPIEDIYRGYGDETLWVYLSEEDRVKYNDMKYTGTIMGILLNQPINYIGLLKWGDEVRLKCLGGITLPILDPDWVVEEGLVEAPKKHEDPKLEDEEEDDTPSNIIAENTQLTAVQIILTEAEKYSEDIRKLAKFKAANFHLSIESDEEMSQLLNTINQNIVSVVIDKINGCIEEPLDQEAIEDITAYEKNLMNGMIDMAMSIYSYELDLGEDIKDL